jgi:hypothetical protein
MLTSPAWYVAICCVPTLFFDLCAVIAVLFPLSPAVAVAAAVARISRISTVVLFGYGLWHFGVFTGLGIIVISIPCAVLTDRCIGKLANGFVERHVAGLRQAAIHRILDKAGIVDLEMMAEMVEELESFDDETLRNIAEEVFDSEAPADALLMVIVARRLDQVTRQADDDATPAEASDVRQRLGKPVRLLVDVEILDEDGRPTSSQDEREFYGIRSAKASSNDGDGRCEV